MDFKFLESNESPHSITEPQQRINHVRENFPGPISARSQDRFIVTFPDQINYLHRIVRSLHLPSLIEGDWSSFTITFYNTDNPPATTILKNLCRFEGFRGDGINIKIELLSPTGEVFGEWRMINCHVTGVDFGELDYNNPGISDITATFNPYFCEFIRH